MKQQRIRFKSRKKFVDRVNAQFKKESVGVSTYRHATKNVNKSRQVARVKKTSKTGSTR